jgi:hypothetical protein
MPLSAKAQASRRAQLKKLEDPKKVRKMRCHNCNKLTPKNRYNQKFCSLQCKREYEQNGGTAFGPLKTRLEKLVMGPVRELQREQINHGMAFNNLMRRFNELLLAVTVMDGQLQKLRTTANETGAAQKPTPEAK